MEVVEVVVMAVVVEVVVVVAVVVEEGGMTCTGLRTLRRREEGAAPGRRPEGGARCTARSQVRRWSQRTCCTALRQAEHTWGQVEVRWDRAATYKLTCFDWSYL